MKFLNAKRNINKKMDKADLQVSKSPKNIYGTVKILERLLEQAENNHGIISITDALLKDLIENTKQEYQYIYEQGRQSC